jgi:hypothetical protein
MTHGFSAPWLTCGHAALIEAASEVVRTADVWRGGEGVAPFFPALERLRLELAAQSAAPIDEAVGAGVRLPQGPSGDTTMASSSSDGCGPQCPCREPDEIKPELEP